MLYLVSTPIGNLADITFRAVEVLKKCDYALCEDTRHTYHLFHHYQIKTSCLSYHQFNEQQREEHILNDLKTGKNIALVSDAGTPGICDPGQSLVKKCREENLPITTLPGPCALISGLVFSGEPTSCFQFVGFLPKKSSDLRKTCIEMFFYPGMSVAYETPHRLIDTLKLMASFGIQRRITVVRELTKIHEECLSGTACDLLEHFKGHPPRGEIVLLVRGESLSNLQSLTPQEQVQQLQKDFDLPLPQAIKIAAQLCDIPKRALYKSQHQDLL